MAVLATYPELDDKPSSMAKWRLFRTPTAKMSNTGPTAAQVATNHRTSSFDGSVAPEMVPVQSYGKILIQPWANGTNNQVAGLSLFGWSESGPGEHIGILDVTFRDFTSAASTGFHTNCTKSVQDAFDSATAWRGADTIAIRDDLPPVHDYWGVMTVKTAETNFPASVLIDLDALGYKYLMVYTIPTFNVTSCGCIFKPVTLRSFVPRTVS